MKEAPDARRLRARIMNVLEMANLPDADKIHVCGLPLLLLNPKLHLM